MKKITVLLLLISNSLFAQITPDQLTDIGNLLDDAIFFSDKYITPATDASVYEQSSSWLYTPKKKKLWDVSLSFHGNLFFVPNNDRKFTINSTDLKFFQIARTINGQDLIISSASVPTAMGPISYTRLVGQIGDSKVRIWTPDGVNENIVTYPYLQGALGLWKGTELIVKYSTKVNLKSGKYQVYGFGLKHNLSQYFNYFEKKKINIAALMAYSKVDLTFKFLDITTDFGTLGINQITSLVDTYQFQLSASKEWNRFEFMIGSIVNKSDFNYQITGPKGTIDNYLNPSFQEIVNIRLKEISKTKYNYIGEISCRYKINKMYLQSTFAFGKFVNSNIAVQYEF
jgi:hypothetical protein